jgi:hypothetical protein
MRRSYGLLFAAAAAVGLAPLAHTAQAQDESHVVAGGGVMIPGWKGMTDLSRRGTRSPADQAKLTKEGDAMHVTTGPAIAYWNPANTASGNYTVKATFTEPKYMSLNAHDHPYGVFIGGNDMDTPNATYLYCAAYGDGRFIVRGFGPAPFQMNGRDGETNAAVHKAAGPGQPVTQEVAIQVKGDDVMCSINGKQVAKYDTKDLVGTGKLKSLDGVYGIRFAHNTEGIVTNFGVSKK